MNKILFFFLLTLMSINHAIAQTNINDDILFYDLNVNFNIDEQSLSGYNEIHFTTKNTNKIEFQLDTLLTVDFIKGKKKNKWIDLPFERKNINIEIALSDKLLLNGKGIIKIGYSGKPRVAAKPPWVGGLSWKKNKTHTPWVGITCQIQGAHLWWPCKTNWLYKPDSMELHFTIPYGLQCISNGILINKESVKNNTTYHWKVSNPISPYNVTANIGPFESITENYTSINGKTFPIELWHLPENSTKAKTFFPQIKEHLFFLEQLLGPYPYSNEKYAVIEAPYLGMEHQTIISIDTLYRDNYAKFNWLHFHELSHEWWGNKISASWKGFWIHEGFAKYMEALYVEYLKGGKHYCKFIASYYNRMLNKQPIAYHNSVEASQSYFIQPEGKLVNRDHSLKGAYFLHLLRTEMGDEAFFKWMKQIIAQYTNQTKKSKQITTQELLELANEISGKSHDELFNEILYKPSIPEKYKFNEFNCLMHFADEDVKLNYMVGQMLLVGFYGTSANETHSLIQNIKKGKIGGVVLYERNINTSNPQKQMKKLIDDIQRAAPTPLFITIDEEGGLVNRLRPKYGFPKNVSATYLGKINHPDSTRWYANSTTKTLKSLGINVNFAPVADLCSNPNNPVIARVKRCYSDNPHEVAKHTNIVSQAHLKQKILPVLKHFPGHGSSSRDSHLGITDVSKSWKPNELIPYQKLIASENCQAIMTAHIINAQLDSTKLPATLSYTVNQKLLRDSLRFNGLLFSDDLQMKAISNYYSLENVLTLTINSGVDVLMFSHNIEGTTDHTIEEIHQTLVKLVKEEKISKQRIEESFDRIRKVKSHWQSN